MATSDQMDKYLNKPKKGVETIDKVFKRSLENAKKKMLRDSEDGAGTMTYTAMHPHGGRGRIGYNKGLRCPHCGKNIDWEKVR